MKRPWKTAALLLAALVLVAVSVIPASAAPQGNPQDGWSVITVWAFVDNDGDGYIDWTVDDGLSDIDVTLTNKKLKVTVPGGTDYGDVWFEPNNAGVFVTWMDVNDPDLPPGLRFNSITCGYSGQEPTGHDCAIRFGKQEAQFYQSAGQFMNVYYGFVPE